jgi:anti-sigma regulatory factor (Ser/Thr protein kinase)
VTAAAEVLSFAWDNGVAIRDCRVIAVCVAELLTTTVRYAQRGELFVKLERDPTAQVVIEVLDRGVGVRPQSEALKLGWGPSTATAQALPAGDNFGVGLGAVMRLMDKVVIRPREGGGAHVTAVKWL